VSVQALALALLSTVRPTTAAAVWAMLVGPRPRRLLAAYLAAGMAVSIPVGVVVVVLLGGAFPRSEATRGVLLIVLGVLALLAAAAVQLGLLRRFRSGRAARTQPRRLSPAGAAVAGILTHLPGVFYLAGLGAIAATGAAAGAATAQVVVYNAVWFAPALVALGICLGGAGPRTDRLATLAARVRAHEDTVLAVVFAGVGAWLLAEGIGAVG
jgi:Sap-like sulfolipid-1-addressing protein